MSRRGWKLVAWGLGAIALASAVGLVVGVVVVGDSPTDLAVYESPWVPAFVVSTTIAWATVGSTVVSKHPTNRVGWLVTGIGLVLGVAQAFIVYADLALYARPQLPAGVAAAVAGNALLAGWNILVVLLLFLFPTGRALSIGWRRVVVACVGLVGFGLVAQVLAPGAIGEFPLANPIAVGGGAGRVAEAAANMNWLAISATALVAVAALVTRYRRSVGVERLQLRWFAYASSLLGVGGFLSFALMGAGFDALSDAVFVLGMVGLLLIPMAIGVALLRYRLYEIDRLVNRTIVYAAVMASLALIYVAGVFGLGSLIRGVGGAVAGDVSESALNDLLVAASTLAAAAAFGPVRSRVQRMVDRRFDRSRYDAARTVGAFGSRLRHEVDVDVLTADLRSVVHATVRPSTATLWLASATGAAATPPRRRPDEQTGVPTAH